MTMHLLRKASASNSDTFGRYENRKLRGTFPIVILVEQAEACKSAEIPDQAHGALEHHSRYGNISPYMAEW